MTKEEALEIAQEIERVKLNIVNEINVNMTHLYELVYKIRHRE